MAKQKGFTQADLERMGMVEVEKGVFKRQSEIKPNTSDITIVKAKVNDSPDFQAKVVTEWFIRSGNVPSKKNSRQNFVKNGKQISIPSKRHAEYVKVTAMQYAIFGKEFRHAIATLGLKYPLKVEFTFIRDSHRRWDYANALQTCEDIMVSSGWIDDDSADHLIPVFAPYEYDKVNSGVRIKLLTR